LETVPQTVSHSFGYSVSISVKILGVSNSSWVTVT